MRPTDDELLARYADPAVQAELDAVETSMAHALLRRLGSNEDSAEALRLVKAALKSHWSAGWSAAGGPSGQPEAPAKKKSKKGGNAICPDCEAARRHAHSDASTPGFFYTECERHRKS